MTQKPYPKYICKDCFYDNASIDKEKLKTTTFTSRLINCDSCGEEEFCLKPEVFGSPEIKGFKKVE